MALEKCPECGHDMSSTAEQCPNCGWKHPPSPVEAGGKAMGSCGLFLTLFVTVPFILLVFMGL